MEKVESTIYTSDARTTVCAQVVYRHIFLYEVQMSPQHYPNRHQENKWMMWHPLMTCNTGVKGTAEMSDQTPLKYF